MPTISKDTQLLPLKTLESYEQEALEHELRMMDFALAPGWLSGPNWTGLAVTEDTLMQLSAWCCGVNVLSEDFALMDCYLYDVDPDTEHLTKDTDNPLYHRLLSEPNDEMTAYEWKKHMAQNAIIYGNGYSEIQLQGRDDMQFWTVEPQHVRPYRVPSEGTLIYVDQRVPTSGPPTNSESGFGAKFVDASEMIHFRSRFSFQGCVGSGIITLGRNLIAYGLALERYGGSYLKNAYKPSFAVQERERTKNSVQAKNAFLASLQKQSSKENAGSGVYIPYPLELIALALQNPEQLQFMQAKTEYVNEVARFLKVHPTKLGVHDETYANSKEYNKVHYNYSIRPLSTGWEQELQMKTLSPIQKKRKRIRFDPTPLIESDALTSAQVGQIAVGQSWLSVNEKRLKDSLPRLGDEYDVIPVPQAQGKPTGDIAPNVDSPDEESTRSPKVLTPKDVNAPDGGLL
jgi:HK97 family phage portal protein